MSASPRHAFASAGPRAMGWLVAATIVLTLACAPTAQAAAPVTYKGAGVVTISSGGSVPAWTWNATTRSWSSTPIASGSSVYLWPWTNDWEWVWTQAAGWRAVSQSYAFVSKPQATVFFDGFDGASGGAPDAARWKIENGPYGYARDACFTGRNVAIDGAGSLALTGRKETSAGCTRQYTAGSVDGRQSFGPPRAGQVITFEARMKASCGSGQWPAFWTTGVGSSWPYHGEIDMVEIYGNRPLEAAHDQHAATASGGHWHRSFRVPAATPWCNGYHTYGVRWSPGRLDYTVDGRVTVSRAKSDFQADWIWPFDVFPQHIKMNLALGGDGPGPIDSTMLPSRTSFDWVHVTSN